jgi:hypothetical protein
MGVQFRITKTAKVFNAICTQNIRAMKDIVKSQHIKFLVEQKRFIFNNNKNFVNTYQSYHLEVRKEKYINLQ